MNKVYEAKDILKDIGMPVQQHTELCCYTLLAMADIKPDTSWSYATSKWIRIHDILAFLRDNYNIIYAENSRETFRKQALHHFRTAALIEDNGKATNSPSYRYHITDEMLALLKTYDTDEWTFYLYNFLLEHVKLIDLYASKKETLKMPVNINGADFTFSPGEHNKLQKAILEEFAPRFAPNCECLYIGDTIKKDLVKNEYKLKELGFEITQHDKMPDVVLYRPDLDWIYFIESVTSVGPIDSKRIIEINEMTADVKSGKVFVTAFLNMKTFKAFSEILAWDTEVWISDNPNHMIHLNGDRFIGPR